MKLKKLFKKIPAEILGIIIVLGIYFYLNYVNASIHVWGAVLGIWIVIIMIDVSKIKRMLKK